MLIRWTYYILLYTYKKSGFKGILWLFVKAFYFFLEKQVLFVYYKVKAKYYHIGGKVLGVYYRFKFGSIELKKTKKEIAIENSRYKDFRYYKNVGSLLRHVSFFFVILYWYFYNFISCLSLAHVCSLYYICRHYKIYFVRTAAKHYWQFFETETMAIYLTYLVIIFVCFFLFRTIRFYTEKGRHYDHFLMFLYVLFEEAIGSTFTRLTLLDVTAYYVLYVPIYYIAFYCFGIALPEPEARILYPWELPFGETSVQHGPFKIPEYVRKMDLVTRAEIEMPKVFEIELPQYVRYNKETHEFIYNFKFIPIRDPVYRDLV